MSPIPTQEALAALSLADVAALRSALALPEPSEDRPFVTILSEAYPDPKDIWTRLNGSKDPPVMIAAAVLSGRLTRLPPDPQLRPLPLPHEQGYTSPEAFVLAQRSRPLTTIPSTPETFRGLLTATVDPYAPAVRGADGRPWRIKREGGWGDIPVHFVAIRLPATVADISRRITTPSGPHASTPSTFWLSPDEAIEAAENAIAEAIATGDVPPPNPAPIEAVAPPLGPVRAPKAASASIVGSASIAVSDQAPVSDQATAPRTPVRKTTNGGEPIWTRADARIVSVVPNPKKRGSAAFERYALWRVGMSPAEARSAGLGASDFRWDGERGYVTWQVPEAGI